MWSSSVSSAVVSWRKETKANADEPKHRTHAFSSFLQVRFQSGFWTRDFGVGWKADDFNEVECSRGGKDSGIGGVRNSRVVEFGDFECSKGRESGLNASGNNPVDEFSEFEGSRGRESRLNAARNNRVDEFIEFECGRGRMGRSNAARNNHVDAFCEFEYSIGRKSRLSGTEQPCRHVE